VRTRNKHQYRNCRQTQRLAEFLQVIIILYSLCVCCSKFVGLFLLRDFFCFRSLYALHVSKYFFLNKQDAYHSKIQAAAFAWGIWPTLTACLLSFRQLRRNWYETTSEHILKLLCDIYWIRCLRSPHATTSWNFLSTSHLIVAPHTAMTLTHSPLYITSTATASSVRPSACNGNGRPGLPCRENWIHGHGVSSIGYPREGLVVFLRSTIVRQVVGDHREQGH